MLRLGCYPYVIMSSIFDLSMSILNQSKLLVWRIVVSPTALSQPRDSAPLVPFCHTNY